MNGTHRRHEEPRRRHRPTVEDQLEELGVSRRRQAVRLLLREVRLHERLTDLLLPAPGDVEELRP